MAANDAKRLKELESENARLKKIMANQTLDIDTLKVIAEKKFWPWARRGPFRDSKKSSGVRTQGLQRRRARPPIHPAARASFAR
jgi:hypothetical protein